MDSSSETTGFGFVCGDGLVVEGEECDDSEPGHLAGHCVGCEFTFRTVFVTAAAYGGNLGGVTGADDLCQASAERAGLHGTFLAWIATGVDDAPSARFEMFDGAYRRVDLQLVAESWESFTNMALANPINVSAGGQPLPPSSCVDSGCVWTGVDSQGDHTEGPLGGCPGVCTCAGWTESGSAGGTAGFPQATEGWSAAAQVQCNLPQHLYCVQQAEAG